MYVKDLLEPQKEFEIEKMTYQNNVSMASSHYHDHYEILYIENGTRTICINETKNISLNPNNIALIPPGIIHSTKSNSPSQSRILINISSSLVEQIIEFLSHYAISGFDTMIIPLTVYDIKIVKWHLTQLLDTQTNKQLPQKEENVKALLVSLLMTLANINYNFLNGDEAPKSSSESYLNIDKILEYIRTHYYEDITLSDLANKAAMSEQHLIRMFSAKFQTTPIKYLNTFRIITAMRLLESNTMNVSEVSISCGFNNSTNFSRVFKQITGVTPKEYQMKQKSKEN